jgi:hypothetical protein
MLADPFHDAPALVASVNSLGFRWYGAKAGSVLSRRAIWQSRICQHLEKQFCPAADGGANTLTSRRFRANLKPWKPNSRFF